MFGIGKIWPARFRVRLRGDGIVELQEWTRYPCPDAIDSFGYEAIGEFKDFNGAGAEIERIKKRETIVAEFSVG